jgi:hypothetical protein
MVHGTDRFQTHDPVPHSTCLADELPRQCHADTQPSKSRPDVQPLHFAYRIAQTAQCGTPDRFTVLNCQQQTTGRRRIFTRELRKLGREVLETELIIERSRILFEKLPGDVNMLLRRNFQQFHFLATVVPTGDKHAKAVCRFINPMRPVILQGDVHGIISLSKRFSSEKSFPQAQACPSRRRITAGR